MTFDDRSACHMRTSPSIPTVFTLLHFPTQENIESMGDIGNRDTSCRREGMEKRTFPSGGPDSICKCNAHLRVGCL